MYNRLWEHSYLLVWARANEDLWFERISYRRPKNYRFLVNTACCGAPNKTFIQLNLFYLFLDCTAGRILFVRVCESLGGFLPHSSCWLLHNSSPSMCPDRMFQPATKANIYLFHVAFNFQKIIYTEGRDTDNITIVMLDSYIEKSH